MATTTNLGITLNTTGGTKTVTATPALNDLIVVVAAASGSTEANAECTEVTDDNSPGTYTKVIDSAWPVLRGASPRISIWIRDALIGSAVSTIFTSTFSSSTGGGLSVFKVTDMTRAGYRAARNADSGAGNAATTPSCSNSTPALTANSMLGGLVSGTNPAAMTPPASWTELPTPDTGYASPDTGLQTCYRDTGETGATITWGSNSASTWRAVILELDTSIYVPTLALNGIG